jgi:hypothetical protein
MQNPHPVLAGKSERKRQLGRAKRRWEDNIKLNLKEIRVQHVNGILLAEDKAQWRNLVNVVMSLLSSQKA